MAGWSWAGSWWDGRHVGIASSSFAVAAAFVVAVRVRRPVLEDRWAALVAAMATIGAAGVAQHGVVVTAAAAVLAVVAVGPPGRAAGGVLEPVLLVVTAAAIYLAVPDTEVALVVGAALAPVALHACWGGGRWSTAATVAWLAALAVAAVDGGWDRRETLAAAVTLVAPVAVVASGAAAARIGRRRAAALVVAHAAVSLFAARRISAWEPATAGLALAVVAGLAVAGTGWCRFRAGRGGGGPES